MPCAVDYTASDFVHSGRQRGLAGFGQLGGARALVHRLASATFVRSLNMSVATKIQWCDSTCNPTMGCDGCELWNPKVKKCYAGNLHVRFGGSTKGYSPTFE